MNESPFANQRANHPTQNLGGLAGQTPPPSPLEQSIQRLSVEVDNLHAELANLYDRLMPCLADTPPTIEKDPTLSPVIGNSSAVRRITELGLRIALIARELVSIKQRLEA